MVASWKLYFPMCKNFTSSYRSDLFHLHSESFFILAKDCYLQNLPVKALYQDNPVHLANLSDCSILLFDIKQFKYKDMGFFTYRTLSYSRCCLQVILSNVLGFSNRFLR